MITHCAQCMDHEATKRVYHDRIAVVVASGNAEFNSPTFDGALSFEQRDSFVETPDYDRDIAATNSGKAACKFPVANHATNPC